jgi:hypothetical protein
MNELTTEQIHYLAGIYEGEGNVQFKNTPILRVSQKDEWLLNRIITICGVGKIYYYSKGKHPFSIWYISGDNARYILGKLYPLLSPRRREQIDIVFSKDVKFQKLNPTASSY